MCFRPLALISALSEPSMASMAQYSFDFLMAFEPFGLFWLTLATFRRISYGAAHVKYLFPVSAFLRWQDLGMLEEWKLG